MTQIIPRKKKGPAFLLGKIEGKDKPDLQKGMSKLTKNTNEIWEEFSDRLKRFILKHIRDKDAAKDILQDIFCKIHDNLHKLKDTDKLEAWIYQIARNVIIDYYRLQKSLGIHEEIPKDRIAEPVSSVNMAKEVALLCVKPMIDHLPENYKEAIIFTEYEGLTQKEMAEMLGLSVSGAKSRVQRARQNLKDMLLGCCHFEFDRFKNILDYQPKKQVCCPHCCENKKETHYATNSI